jgi:ABC-type multidrug transport system fused ATPase/permease subunit
LSALDQLWNFGNNLRRTYESFADATEMVDIMNEPREVVDAPDAAPLAPRDGTIEFKDATFAFQDGKPVLEHLNLRIGGHQKVALVGPSGAGKTTITKLILRFYDLTGGSIEIDGQDIAKVSQDSLRAAIAFVPQEPVLFHRSLMENIRYGRRDATDEEVIEAAKQAHCYEFIMATRYGFETFVGERGIKLSGGERQRIAIARAILKDAPILILDEATSSLDSESEALIQDALARLMEGKTVIAIAHRLSTVMRMDRIIVVEGGAVAMDGTHDELLAHEGGLYQKLWEIQAGGFIVDDEA